MWLHRLISSAIAGTLLLHNHMQDGFPTSSILYASTSLPIKLHPNGSTWPYSIIDQVVSSVQLLYIVYMGERQHEDPDLVTASHHDMLSSVLGSKEEAVSSIVYNYKHGFSGFAAMLTESKAHQIAGQNFTVKHCNRKIIGARWYDRGVDDSDISVDYRSPRDFQGHGTHTASTAAGSFVGNASFHGLGAGVARGGAPSARLAIYKACWAIGGCPDAAVLKAIDDAIHDGVDILSLSLSELLHPIFASIHAVAKGITVIFAGGNDGPVPQTISNDLPWVITVAASTIDRSFPTDIILGNGRTLVGQSMCYASSDPGYKELVPFGSCSVVPQYLTQLADKIVLCFDAAGETSLLLAGLTQAGARGAIIARFPRSLLPDCSGIACVLVDYDVGGQIANYAKVENASGRIPVVRVSPASNIVGNQVMSPRVAAFSSRGPSIYYPDLVKPDITAPGVDILAAVRDGYQFMSGTSMACPHVSGIAALLKVVHPHWSPAAIKSALVTTAHTANAYGFPIEAEGVPRKLADPFDFGGGHIDPNKAADPGLIYDVDPEDYFKIFISTYARSITCGLLDSRLYHLNLPSISIPDLKKTPLTVWRTVTNVGDTDSIYRAMVESPPGVNTVVEPSLLLFNASTTTHTFAVTFTPLMMVQGDFNFGSLTWFDDGKHAVRIPIAVRVIIHDFISDTS
nr:PREDICTED: subtilisin-like protease SBT3.3 [Musa acuminata subsp. malaccensis]